MKTYIEGYDVYVTLPLVDQDGEPVVPTAASYTLLDESGTELLEETPLSVLGDETELVVAVSSVDNYVAFGSTRSLRSVSVVVTTDSGSVFLSESYVIEKKEPLVVTFNSFQGFSEAEFLATTVRGVETWMGADKGDRVSTMIEAWENICRLHFQYDTMEFDGDLDEVTPEVWGVLDQDFVRALKVAQIIEADGLLGGGKTAAQRAREDGVVSITVGESSQTFRKESPARSALNPRAKKYLSPYLAARTVKIGRA